MAGEAYTVALQGIENSATRIILHISHGTRAAHSSNAAYAQRTPVPNPPKRPPFFQSAGPKSFLVEKKLTSARPNVAPIGDWINDAAAVFDSELLTQR